MAGILNDKLTAKVDQLQELVRQKLMGVYGCNAEVKERIIAEIATRIKSELKVLLGNALSVLSQEFLDRFSDDYDRMQRYFDLDPEKKIKEKYQFDYDIADKLKSVPVSVNERLKVVGIGGLGAMSGAFVARRLGVSVLSLQFVLIALVSAVICGFAASTFLSSSIKKRYAEAVSAVAGDFHAAILEWLDNIDKDFRNIVSSI